MCSTSLFEPLGPIAARASLICIDITLDCDGAMTVTGEARAELEQTTTLRITLELTACISASVSWSPSGSGPLASTCLARIPKIVELKKTDSTHNETRLASREHRGH